MKICVIGSGNVAYHLAKALVKANQEVIQIFGRNNEALKTISEELDIPFSTREIAQSELYLIAVSDSAVEEISKLISEKNTLVVHTSGSLPLEILSGNYRKAVFYPLQTFSKAKQLDYSKIPFFIETEIKSDFDVLKNIALSISPSVAEATFEKRIHIHLTAVFVSNFVNHLFTKAQEIADSQNIPFDYFLPLIHETIEKIEKISPKFAQTGPARRNDKRILSAHEELLKDHALEIYKTMNQSILKLYDL